MKKKFVVCWDFGEGCCFYKYFSIRDKAKLFLSELRAEEQPEGYQMISRSTFDKWIKEAKEGDNGDQFEYVR